MQGFGEGCCQWGGSGPLEPGDQPSHASGLLTTHPRSFSLPTEISPSSFTHRAFIHSLCTSLTSLSGTLFPVNPLHYFTGLTLEVRVPPGSPSSHSALHSGSDPDCAVLSGRSCSLLHHSWGKPLPCSLPVLQESGLDPSPLCSALKPTPRPALSAFSISTCQMNECITHTNKKPLPECREGVLHPAPAFLPQSLLVH